MSTLHLMIIFLVVLIWGFNFVVIYFGLQGIPPLFLVFLRFFLTSVPAVFFFKRPEVPFRYVARYGLILFALQFSILFWGLSEGISAGLASILLQLQAFFTIPLAIYFFGEKPNPWQIIGALISFSGIGLVAANLGGDITPTGLILVITAAFFWALGNILSKKMGKIHMLSLVVWGSLVAWPPMLLISLWIEGPDAISHCIQNFTWMSAGAVLYIVFLATWFGFGIWNWLLQRYPLATVAPFTLLVPIVGIFGSALFLDEVLHMWKMEAAALILGGLGINIVGQRLVRKREIRTD